MRVSLLIGALGALVAIGAFGVPINSLKPKETRKSKVVLDSSIPLFYEGTLYYWKEYYVHNPRLPTRCEFQAKDKEWPFANAFDLKGGVLNEMVFGCEYMERCQEDKCTRSPTFGFMWGAVLFSGMCVALLAFIRFWACREPAERVEVASVEMGDFSSQPIIPREL